MRRILDAYCRLLKFATASMLLLLLIPVSLQVFARYTDVIPRFIWTEEIARFAFIWMILIGSIIAAREGTHFNVDVLPRMPPAVQRLLDLVTNLAMLIFAVILIIGGYKFAQFGSIQRSELAGLPMLAIFIAWPLAGVSWLLFAVERIVDQWRGQKTENDHGPL